MEENNCFICFESENLVKMECACVERFVHEKCILKWLENKDNECGVCKTNYKNVVLKHNPKKIKYGLMIAIYLLFAFGLGIYMLIQGFISYPQNKSLIMWGSLCLLISFVSIIATFALISYEMKMPEKKYMMKT